jgi:hypothetical protein
MPTKRKPTKKKAKPRVLTTADIPKIAEAVLQGMTRGAEYARFIWGPTAPVFAPPSKPDHLKEIRAKLERGVDLTPPEFPLPSPASYFAKDEESKELIDGFTDAFIAYVEHGMSQADAYITACRDFSRPCGERRASNHEGIFSIPTAEDLFK